MAQEFKGTKGKLQKVYQSGICIGIGVIQKDGYTEMTANSILPDCDDMTDKEVDKYMEVLEADMTLYSHAPEMLEYIKMYYKYLNLDDQKKAEELITKATTI